MRHAAAFLLTALLALTARAQTSSNWPHTFASSVGNVTVYEPQVDSFSNNTLTSHAAVSFVPSGTDTPVFGAMWFSATVQTDRESRTVQILSASVTNSRFPQADQAQVAAITQAITSDATTLTLSLDNILASLSVTQQQTAASTNLNNTPPQIVYSDVPAVLVTLDGQPQLQQVPNTGLMKVVNTPFFIALDPASKMYYLRGPGVWMSATNVMGPWQVATNVPKPVKTLANAQTPDAKNTDKTSNGQQAPQGNSAPRIIVATQPTELIQTDGTADFTPISGTNLLYVSNTDSDVFMDISSQSLYVLLSGRWYTAPSQNGPWIFVAPNQLPPDFAQIPAGSPKADVLASVAGTPVANNAVLDAAVPQTAAVNRTAAAPKVEYDGDPKFETIQGTSMQYAVNTSHSVVKVENSYYLCADGVWFSGAAALGPWIVTDAVPDVIYTIPPTCPVYNVTFCYVYSATPSVVYCGYLPGYVGSYVWGGTVVYGTGWPYAPWISPVAYIPRPVTWGFAAAFNPVSCGWGFAVGFGWGATFGAAWHGSSWWGPSGWHGNSWNNNSWNNNNWHSNNTVNINNTTNNNIYNKHNSWTNNGNINNSHNNNNGNGNKIAHNGNNDGNHHDNAERNDVYAGNDGNVYKHSLDGWQQHTNDGWQNTKQNANHDNFQQHVQPQLNRDFNARSGGGGRSFSGGGGGRRR